VAILVSQPSEFIVMDENSHTIYLSPETDSMARTEPPGVPIISFEKNVTKVKRKAAGPRHVWRVPSLEKNSGIQSAELSDEFSSTITRHNGTPFCRAIRKRLQETAPDSSGGSARLFFTAPRFSQ